MACVSIMDTLGKLLAAEIHVLQVTWARFFFILCFFVPFFLRSGPAGLVRSGNLRLQLLRALLQLVASFSFFTALSHLPLADVVAVAFSAPLFILALSAPLLGERPGARRWAAVTVGLGGVAVMIRPGFDTHWAMVLPLVAAFCFALFQILTRMLARTDGSLTTLFYSTVVGAVILSAVAPAIWIWPSPTAWAMMIGLGAFGALGHFLMVEAFSAAPASSLAPFTYSEIVWATSLGYLVFADIPDVWVVAGTAVVIGSGLYAFSLERRDGRR